MKPQQTQSCPGNMSAADAGRPRRSAFQRLMAAATEARSMLAASTEPKPKPAGAKPTTPDLTDRALRLHNRSKDDAERYLTKHQILDRRA